MRSVRDLRGIEHTTHLFQRERFGLTATATQTLLWLDEPDDIVGRYSPDNGGGWAPVAAGAKTTSLAPSPVVGH